MFWFMGRYNLGISIEWMEWSFDYVVVDSWLIDGEGGWNFK